jgi:hypothetical protein
MKAESWAVAEHAQRSLLISSRQPGNTRSARKTILKKKDEQEGSLKIR